MAGPLSDMFGNSACLRLETHPNNHRPQAGTIVTKMKCIFNWWISPHVTNTQRDFYRGGWHDFELLLVHGCAPCSPAVLAPSSFCSDFVGPSMAGDTWEREGDASVALGQWVQQGSYSPTLCWFVDDGALLDALWSSKKGSTTWKCSGWMWHQKLGWVSDDWMAGAWGWTTTGWYWVMREVGTARDNYLIYLDLFPMLQDEWMSKQNWAWSQVEGTTIDMGWLLMHPSDVKKSFLRVLDSNCFLAKIGPKRCGVKRKKTN